MKSKLSKIVVSVIIIVTMFTMSYSIISAKGDQIRDKDRITQRDRDCTLDVDCTQDQLRQRDRDCQLDPDCTQDQLRQRDRDCQFDCIFDQLCTQDQLHLRINKDEVIEDILLYQDLQNELVEAEEENNSDLIEDILPKLEEVKLRLEEMLKKMIEEVEKLQLRETIQNNSGNGKLYQLRYRISSMEDIIETIEDILE